MRKQTNRILKSIRQSLIKLADLVGDAQINSAVTNLDNQTTQNIRINLEKRALADSHNCNPGSRVSISTYLRHNPQLLPLTIFTLCNCRLNLLQYLGIKFLKCTELALIHTHTMDRIYPPPHS
jgi:hypothetical protein